MKRGIGKAHGKIILSGEHSVVYGYRALALPIEAVTIQVSLEESSEPTFLMSELYQGPLTAAPSHLDNLRQLWKSLQEDHSDRANFLIRIDSNIPAERGMGSSAAVAVALIRAYYDFYNEGLDQESLLAYADLAETISHGNPSGLDARLTVLNRPLSYQKGQSMEVFYFQTPYYLLVADTGIPGNTKEAVAGIRQALDSEHPSRHLAAKAALEELGQASEDLYQHLSGKAPTSLKAIAQSMQASQINLQTLQVSSPELDMGIRSCLDHGAAAAKLTGGGKGGCFIALMPTQKEAEDLGQSLVAKEMIVDYWLIPLASPEPS
ncbi:mevalonate kinase [Aerococcus sp. UMB7834]|uniref:mevalonate kinase n=1 Tax=Aerococcus sp. UMB7834 TaxID=3046342 RepID=UPI00254AAD43|nr:mevalonate kinase [Aerococcus sp. UMB7834]MDK6805233.1 mevalonate kinase [Aerococcus sp. UMB7834]